MEFRKKIELPLQEATIRQSDPLLLMGSCFVENMGQQLQRNKFRCRVNPFGVLYNPLSIAASLQRLMDGKMLTREELLLFPGEGWNSWLCHSSFAAPDVEACLEGINRSVADASSFLRQTQWLFLTFGTAWVYRLKETGEVVANCHKKPVNCFVRTSLLIEEIEQTYLPLFAALFQQNPTLQVLLTVSPIRHTADGAHGNQLSKAVLLLAVDRLVQKFPNNCHYFPAYELVLDELRDYRFYAEDMVHPSSLTVSYLWECFQTCYFTPQTRAFLEEWGKIRQALDHRPFRPKSKEYQQFLCQILLKIQEIKKIMPYLDVQNEIDKCQQQLKP